MSQGHLGINWQTAPYVDQINFLKSTPAVEHSFVTLADLHELEMKLPNSCEATVGPYLYRTIYLNE